MYPYQGDDSTRQIVKILLVFMLSISILIPPAVAWNPQTHRNIVSAVHSKLPLSIQKKLNLNEMKKGAVAPDAVFKDFSIHEYPKSTAKAQGWLNKGKTAYKKKNYKYASYCFGVASHYISDTFVAPHCLFGESKAQHKSYENQANNMYPSIGSRSGSLKTLLASGYKQGKSSWKSWVKTKKSSIPKKALNNAGSACYSLIRKCV